MFMGLFDVLPWTVVPECAFNGGVYAPNCSLNDFNSAVRPTARLLSNVQTDLRIRGGVSWKISCLNFLDIKK